MLAAGAGRRFGRPKAGVRVDGERLVDRAVRVLRSGGATEVVVILGAEQLEVPDAIAVWNGDWESGMASSLVAGLRACESISGDSACVSLVDLPGLTAEAVRRVASDDPAALRAATYDGQRGHPVVFGRDRWAAVADSVSGDSGANAYLLAHLAQLELIEVGDVAAGTDLDVAGDRYQY